MIGLKTLRNHQTRVIIAAAVMAVVLAVGIRLSLGNAYAEGSTPVAADTHIVTVHDDGVDKGLITHQKTLRAALKEAHIRLDAKDRTEPSLDEPLVASSYQVNIYRARPVVVRDGDVETTVLTSYRSPQQIAKEAHITLHDADITTLSPAEDPTDDGAAEVMTITRATGFLFNFYGMNEQSYTQAATVGAMLKEKGITLGPKDGVSPSPTTPITAGMHVRLWRDGVQTVTKEEVIDFSVKQIKDPGQPIGYQHIETSGQKGRRTVTYEIVLKHGKEVSRKEINSVTTQQPTQEVVRVGTKNTYSGSLNDWLYQLRMCETHGNYKTNTGNSYYGAYQFSQATWDSLGTGYARADLAPAAVQDAAIIKNTLRSAGLVTQNPGCYAKTGISNKPPAS